VQLFKCIVRPGGKQLADELETLEVTTGDTPVASVIWLHGLGADGHDFAPLVPELKLPVATRFIFPHAPVRPVTINMGARMRAWYDVLSLQRTDMEDEAGIYASADAVAALIDVEVERGVPSNRIVIAGFSQGGAIALHVALRYPQRLAGVIALSTYLPLSWKLDAERSPANASVPLLIAHGAHDAVLPEALGQAARDLLQQHGYDIEWHSYQMAHSVCSEEVAEINRWLTRHLA
jgi:phospholipase/carboxylesterase